MNIIDLLKLNSKVGGSISVLGFGEIATSLKILKGMINNTLIPESFDIQIEPNPINLYPKALDIFNEGKNRLGLNSSILKVEVSKYNGNASTVVINSLTNTENLLNQVYFSVPKGTVILLPLYGINDTVRKDTDNFTVENKTELFFDSSKEIAYLMKDKTLYKTFNSTKITRTKSLMT